MRRIVSQVCILLLVLGCKSKDKEATPPPPAAQPVRQGKFSAAFGSALDGVMASYDGLVSNFSKGDTTAIGKEGRAFLAGLDSLSFKDFATDTIVYQTATQQLADTRTELSGLLGEVTLDGRRQSFNMVSQDLYDLLRTIRYDRKPLYFAECTTALGEDKPGDWISTSGDTTRMVNPYRAAPGCAQVKDSLPTRP